MSRRIWFDEDDQPYFQLLCDTCQQPFLSYDDSCYDWRLLCDAATVAGWQTGAADPADPAGPHRCGSCQQRRPSPVAA
jgi:hypothetical protein